MSAALDKLSKDESVKLKDLIRGAQNSKQPEIKSRVDKYKKALESLKNTATIVSEMEERVKKLEPLSKQTIDGIEEIFKKFSGSSEQSPETTTQVEPEETTTQDTSSQEQQSADDQSSES